MVGRIQNEYDWDMAFFFFFLMTSVCPKGWGNGGIKLGDTA